LPSGTRRTSNEQVPAKMTGGRASAGRAPSLPVLALFHAPALIVYTLFSAWPLVATIAQSVTAPAGEGTGGFVGIDNFRTLFTDPYWADGFWNALGNTVVFFLIHMAVQNPVGIGLAALLAVPRLKGRSLYRTAFFLPTMLSVVIVGFVWQLILSPLWGVGEGLLSGVGLGHWFAPWLGEEATALVTLSLISVWQFIGVPMLLVHVALLNIPQDLMDAARVDGAGPLGIFARIQLPLVLPTIGLVSILTFIGNFNAFDLIYAVKGPLAGPNFSTDILGTYFYRTFFGHQLQAGDPTMGATVATVMFGIILAGVALYLLVMQRRVLRSH
jgi:raffinose/stachyose/melibiose transport system permease protein